MAQTMKERAHAAIDKLPLAQRVDIRDYVTHLEGQLAIVRVERNNLRDPRGGNY